MSPVIERGLTLRRLRVPVAILLAVMVATSLYVLPDLRFTFSILPLLEANDQARAEVDRMQAELPPRQFDQICLLEWPRRIEHAELASLAALGTALEESGQVATVLSLATAKVILPGSLLRGTPLRGTLLPAVRRFPDTVGGRSVYDAARQHSLLMRTLLSADGRSACVLVQAASQAVDRDDLLAWLRGFVPRHLEPDVVVRFLGGVVAREAMRQHMLGDVVRIVSWQLALFAILLPLLFRSIRGVVVPLVSVLIAITIGFGVLIVSGQELSILDLAIPGLMTVIGLCDAVHLIVRFEEALGRRASRDEAIVDMLRHVGMACLFTSITTGIGFASLQIADHAAVREFGLKAAAAVAITFLSVLLTVSTALSFWRVRDAAPARVPGLARLRYGRPLLTVAACSIAVVVSVFGASRIVVDSHWLEELPRDDPVVADLRWYEENFAGLMTLDVEVVGDLKDPNVFQAIEQLQVEMLRLDGVNQAESYTHWVREAAGQPDTMTAPDVQRGIALLALAGVEFPRHVVRRDFAMGRIAFRTNDVGTHRYFEIVARLEELAAGMPQRVRARVTGFMQMAHQSARLVVTTMVTSFGLSLLMISLLIALIYRSPRIALISILPNGIPILIALGVTGWLGIPLRIGIVMIYSVGLGLAVDDTIHLLTRFRQERDENPDESVRVSLLRSLHTSGAALIVTSAILVCGSLCHLSADYTSLRDVGVLMSTIVGTALLADLFVLPVLLERCLIAPRCPQPGIPPAGAE